MYLSVSDSNCQPGVSLAVAGNWIPGLATKRSTNHSPAILAPANHRPASRHQPSNWEINLPSTAGAGRTQIIESRVRPLSNAELLLQRMRISSLASDTLCIVSKHDCQEEMIFTIVNHHFLRLNSAQLLLKLSECKQARPWDGASYPTLGVRESIIFSESAN